MSKDCIIVINAYPNFIRNEDSIESIRAASKRWGADFIEINRLIEKGNNISKKLFFTRYENLLKFSTVYDRILMIDNDTVVNSNSPNIFDELGDHEIAGVLDGNPERFSGNWIKDSIVRHIVNLFDYGCLNGILEFDKEKHFEKYLNEGVILWNICKVKDKLANFMNTIDNEPKILEALETDISIQNMANVFFSHVLDSVKILDDKWNWTMPDVAGKNGWFHDHFNPETGELIKWWEDNESPPDWSDNIFRGRMHPYIYHFCGTPGSKEIGKTYNRW